MKKRGIKTITIPPYSSQLNPTEQIIVSIKSKIKKSWLNHKLFSFTLVKKIVDEMYREA